MQRDGKSVCSVTGRDLDTYDLADNGVRIGSDTILLLPSFKNLPKLGPVSMPIMFNVIECTNLASLSEGLFLGSSHVVLPSSNHEMDVTTEDGDQIEANHEIFSGFCQILNSMDRGLICTSTFDVEDMCEATFLCFYVLLPSDNGPMLLRRIAAAEEFLPTPDAVEAMDIAISDELRASINSCLSKMGFQDYNPLNHKRGCHTKLNWLVKESLQFRSIPMTFPKSQPENMRIEKTQMHDRLNMSPGQDVEKQIPSILERMEPPRAFNKRSISSSPSKAGGQNQSNPAPQHTQAHDASYASKGVTDMKKPLFPFQQSQLLSPSPKLKPNFRRIKRMQT